MIIEVLSPTGNSLPVDLESSIRELAERAQILIKTTSTQEGLQIEIHGTEIESKYLTRCLLRAGYDLAI